MKNITKDTIIDLPLYRIWSESILSHTLYVLKTKYKSQELQKKIQLMMSGDVIKI